MPSITIWKLFLIICIAGFAAAAVSIGHAEKASIIEKTYEVAAAKRAASPMCPSVQGQMSGTAGVIYKRYLGHMPMTRVAVR